MQKSVSTSPLVSVIVPVHNAQSTVEKCIQSVLSQSWCELEVIAVDDGSTDDSLALLNRMAINDDRLRVLSQPNGGVASARNAAIDSASGTYLQFVDSDDVLPEGATEYMLSAMETHACDLVIAPYTEVVGNHRQLRGYLKSDQLISQHMLLDRLSKHPNSFYYAVMWNKLYRRDLIVENSIRCDGRLPWGEDFAFNTQYYRYAQQIAVLSSPVYDYVRNPSGLALSTARACIIHPIYSIRVKFWLHAYYKRLYVETGLYEEYRHVLNRYMFGVAINN